MDKRLLVVFFWPASPKTCTPGLYVISQATDTSPGNDSDDATVHFLMYDGHGSIRYLTDLDNGNIVANELYNYDAYGVSLATVGLLSQNQTATNLLYAGEMFDRNLQMYSLRARYYNPNIGRFNRLDPFIGDNNNPLTLNKYGYCHGDPVNGIDPSGLFTFSYNELLLSISTLALMHSFMQIATSDMGLGWGVDSEFSKYFPDAGVIGVVGSFKEVAQIVALVMDAHFTESPIGPHSAIAKKGIVTGVIGVEILFSIVSAQIAVYIYGGASLKSPSKNSASVYSSLVWNLENVHDYEGVFYSGGASAGRWGGSGFLGDNGRTIGVSFGRSWGGNSFGGSITYYKMIWHQNFSSMHMSILMAAAWSAASTQIVSPGNWNASVAAAAVGSFWPYTKWQNSKELNKRQGWRPPMEL